MEPTVEGGWWHGTYDKGIHGIMGLVRQRDKWPSLEAAWNAFAKSRYYGRFDPRVLEKVLQYDLIENPKAQGGGVTFTLPKSQQVAVMVRTDPPLPGYPVAEDYQTRQEESRTINGFYRPEGSRIKECMKAIHCKTLLMWSSEDNSISDQPYRERFTKELGTGLMGGGGLVKGQVDEIFVERGRHNFPFENPQESGAIVASWLENVMLPAYLQEESERTDDVIPTSNQFQQGFLQRMKEVRPMGKSSKL